MAGNWRPCPQPGCPELVNRNNPCPRLDENNRPHMRPRNAAWSTDRNPREQATFRRRILAAANNTCQRCGAQNVELQAHHTQGDNGLALCRPCHRSVDAHAR